MSVPAEYDGPLVRRCANCDSYITIRSRHMDGVVWFHVPAYWDGACEDPVPGELNRPPSIPESMRRYDRERGRDSRRRP